MLHEQHRHGVRLLARRAPGHPDADLVDRPLPLEQPGEVLGEGGDTQRLVRELERMAKTSLFTEEGLARARERRADKEDEAAE